MWKIILAVLLVCAVSLPALAFFDDEPQQSGTTAQGTQTSENGQGNPNGFNGPGHQNAPGQNGANFEQRKEELINRINARISHLQGLSSCLQSAQNHQAAGACMDKFGPVR